MQRPLFRSDLVPRAFEENGEQFVEVTDPQTGATSAFYEVEYAIACGMDGTRDLAALADWAKAELGLEASTEELSAVVKSLNDLGYLTGDKASDGPVQDEQDDGENEFATDEKTTAAPMLWQGGKPGEVELGLAGQAARPEPRRPVGGEDVELGASGTQPEEKIPVGSTEGLELGAPGLGIDVSAQLTKKSKNKSEKPREPTQPGAAQETAKSRTKTDPGVFAEPARAPTAAPVAPPSASAPAAAKPATVAVTPPAVASPLVGNTSAGWTDDDVDDFSGDQATVINPRGSGHGSASSPPSVAPNLTPSPAAALPPAMAMSSAAPAASSGGAGGLPGVEPMSLGRAPAASPGHKATIMGIGANMVPPSITQKNEDSVEAQLPMPKPMAAQLPPRPKTSVEALGTDVVSFQSPGASTSSRDLVVNERAPKLTMDVDVGEETISSTTLEPPLGAPPKRPPTVPVDVPLAGPSASPPSAAFASPSTSGGASPGPLNTAPTAPLLSGLPLGQSLTANEERPIALPERPRTFSEATAQPNALSDGEAPQARPPVFRIVLMFLLLMAVGAGGMYLYQNFIADDDSNTLPKRSSGGPVPETQVAADPRAAVPANPSEIPAVDPAAGSTPGSGTPTPQENAPKVQLPTGKLEAARHDEFVAKSARDGQVAWLVASGTQVSAGDIVAKFVGFEAQEVLLKTAKESQSRYQAKLDKATAQKNAVAIKTAEADVKRKQADIDRIAGELGNYSVSAGMAGKAEVMVGMKAQVKSGDPLVKISRSDGPRVTMSFGATPLPKEGDLYLIRKQKGESNAESCKVSAVNAPNKQVTLVCDTVAWAAGTTVEVVP